MTFSLPSAFMHGSSLQANEDELLMKGNHEIMDDELSKEGEAKSTAVRAGANMTKSFIGAASFALPWAFMQGGLLGSIIGLIFLAFVTNYTIKLLSECRKMTTNPDTCSYPDVGREAAGMVGLVAVYTSVIAMNLGVCSSYISFISDNLSSVLVNATGNDFFSPIICILLVFPVVWSLAMIRSYRFLLFTSVPGCLALIIAMIVSYGYFFADYSLKPLSYYPMFQFTSYAQFFGSAAFLFCIHSVVIPIEQSMENKEKFGRVTDVSMSFVTILNMSFAVICYLLLGYCTQGSVTDNLPPGWIPNITKIFLVIDLLFTYTIFMIPLSETLEKLFRITSSPDKPYWHFVAKYVSLRTVLVFATIIFALAIPKFNEISSLVGGVANNTVAIILPPLFYLALLRKRGKPIVWWMYVVNFTVPIIGIIAGLATIISTSLSLAGVDFAIGIELASGADPATCIATDYYTYAPAWL